MGNARIKILAVDDEEINLEILQDDLSIAGYEVLCADNGKTALDILQGHPDIKVILLDRMMPMMDGMELITELKNSERYNHIPVIMQTGAALTNQVREGIEAGVYYYLTKPYDEKILLAIVAAALEDTQKFDTLQQELQSLQGNINDVNAGLQYLKSCVFEYSTLKEVKSIAFIMANSCPDPKRVVLGLSEIMQNAIEHGNLGLTLREKSELLVNGLYQQEIDHRLGLAGNRDKRATVEMQRTEKKVQFIVTDEGPGFAWRDYLRLIPGRATLPNGRGIAMAAMFSFDNLEFMGCGNKAICAVNID